MAGDLFNMGYNCVSLKSALSRRQDICEFCVNFESSTTPKRFVSLVHAVFSLKFFSERTLR
jgi:hypothetical protein